MGFLACVFYLIGMMSFITGFYSYKKSNHILSGIPHIFISIITWMVVQASLYAFYYVLRLPCASWQFAIYDFLIGGAFWFQIYKRKERQRYHYYLLDGIMVVFLFLLVCGLGFYQFGRHLQNFHYSSLQDSALHLRFAYLIANGGVAPKHFFAALNTGLLMDATRSFVPLGERYRIFILFDLLVLFLHGILFWSVIRSWLKTRFCQCVGIVGVLLYICGHPWNSMVMGTSYFSTGQLLCLFIVYLFLQCFEKELYYDFVKILLILACFALYFCYSLFIPVFILASFIYCFYFQKIKKRQMTSSNKRKSIYLWLFIFAAVIVFFYFAFVKGSIFYVTLMDLFAGGLMYGNLWEDFLFFIPLVSLAFCVQWKNKKLFLPAFLLIANVGYIILFQIGHYYHRISLYYTYKNYASLWMLAFLCSIWAICQYGREIEKLFVCYITPWILILILFITKVDRPYYLANPHYPQNNIATACLPLYQYNRNEAAAYQGREYILNQLIAHSARISAKKNIYIPMIADRTVKGWEDSDVFRCYYLRYKALSGQNPIHSRPENARKAIKNNPHKYHYLLVLRGMEQKYQLKKLYQFKKVLWKNQAGYVVQVKPCSD